MQIIRKIIVYHLFIFNSETIHAKEMKFDKIEKKIIKNYEILTNIKLYCFKI